MAEPSLFAADVAWSHKSFGSREVPIDDLQASLECLRDTLAEELPASSVEHTTRYLEVGLEASATVPSEPGAAVKARDGNELALRFLEATLSGERRRALGIVLDAVSDGLPVATVYTEVLTEAQRMVGELWHQGDLSVAQEHFVTATVRDIMAIVAHEADHAGPRGRSALVALAPGNAHEIASRALADLLEIDGWKAVYLGGNMPSSDLAIALDHFEADLLCLSIALSTQLREARSSIRAARAAKPGLRILVGGAVLLHAPGIWKKIDADAGAADIEKAVAAAAKLADSA